MSKRIFTTLFLFIIFICETYAQFSGLEGISKDIIKNANVYKCLEINVDNASKTNSSYFIYNQKGELIEFNIYSIGTEEEMIVHNVYDKNGNLILWFWYNENSKTKIIRVHSEEYDSLGNKFGYKDYFPNTVNLNTKTRYYETTNNNKSETIYSHYGRTEIIKTINTNESIFITKYFYQDSLKIDSSIYYDKSQPLTRVTNSTIIKKTTKYFYSNTGILEKKIISSFNSDNEIIYVETFNYYPSGIYKNRQIVNNLTKKSNSFKYEYEYWN